MLPESEVKSSIKLSVKDHILTEADQLFCQYGFKSVTMDDIARHLGISKRTIYQHFTDKNELVTVLLEAKLAAHDCSMKAYSKQANDAIHEIFLGFSHINEWLNTLNAKLFYDLQKYHLSAWVKFKNFKEKTLRISITKNLKRGLAEGLYRTDIDIHLLTQLRLDQGSIIFNQSDLYTTNTRSLVEVMKEVTQHFVYGVANLKGRERIELYKELSIKQ